MSYRLHGAKKDKKFVMQVGRDYFYYHTKPEALHAARKSGGIAYHSKGGTLTKITSPKKKKGRGFELW